MGRKEALECRQEALEVFGKLIETNKNKHFPKYKCFRPIEPGLK